MTRLVAVAVQVLALLVARPMVAGADDVRVQGIEPLLSGGQVQAQPTPDAVMRQFFRDFSSRRWDEAAAALDLKALGDYRDSLLVWRRRWIQPRETTVEDLLRTDPDLPRAVAEYQLAQMRRFRERTEVPEVPEFPGVPNIDSLRTLPLLALGVSWLHGRDIREQMRRDLRRLGCPPSADSLFQQIPLAVEVLGAVATSDSLAYVLFSEPALGPARTDFHSLSPMVARMRRSAGSWRIIPTSSFLTHVNTFSQLAACPGVPRGY